MFYTLLFTSKRGSLAKIWLAAHWERKLTKAHVFECNLETTIREIISPKMKIGLRTSGHLLLGVVRIYSRKAKYLLGDCSDALVKVKAAFRPGQTDMTVEGLEATIKAITLIEDFTTFDSQLPDPSDIDVVDHFSLNQSRPEEITLKEDFGKSFLNFEDVGDECQGHGDAVLDVNIQSLAQREDAFGDEDDGFDLLDFLTQSSDNATDFILEEPQNEIIQNSPLNDQRDANRTDSMEVETPTANQTTLLVNEGEAFALEPVPITPNSTRKKGKRKRKLVVDQTKELSNEYIREQLSDFSDLVDPLEMAPPTVQLMQWKESGGAKKLFAQPCSTVISPQIKELFAKSFLQVKCYGVHEDVEVIRQEEQNVQSDRSAFAADISIVDSSVDPEKTHTELTEYDDNNQHESYPQLAQDENRSEFTHPSLPSEDSMFVHPSYLEHSTQSTSLHTQVLVDTQLQIETGQQTVLCQPVLLTDLIFGMKSILNSQDFEERRITRQAQKLLNALKQSQSDSSDPTFSLQALCEGSSRWQAATTFFCLLILKKQQVLRLRQHAPYEDIVATPGPKFCN